MGLFKDINNAFKFYADGGQIEDAPLKYYDVRSKITGDTGTVEEFRTALQAAVDEVEKKRRALAKIKNLTSNKSHDAYNAFSEALQNLNVMKEQFCKGAIEGFYFGRVKNIQAILAKPEDFLQTGKTSGHDFAADILVTLLIRSFKPEGVPQTALAGITTSRISKQTILNKALEKLTAAPQDDKTAACIEALRQANAGAPVRDPNAKITIRPQGAPKKLVKSPGHRYVGH